MKIKVKKEKEKEYKGVLASLGEGICVLTAYAMVFYFFWEGLLKAAGAK